MIRTAILPVAALVALSLNAEARHGAPLHSERRRDAVMRPCAGRAFVGGGQSYGVSPNRPIDFTDAICYAPYASGTALDGQSIDAGA
jgi:hypothetical protein